MDMVRHTTRKWTDIPGGGAKTGEDTKSKGKAVALGNGKAGITENGRASGKPNAKAVRIEANGSGMDQEEPSGSKTANTRPRTTSQSNPVAKGTKKAKVSEASSGVEEAPQPKSVASGSKTTAKARKGKETGSGMDEDEPPKSKPSATERPKPKPSVAEKEKMPAAKAKTKEVADRKVVERASTSSGSRPRIQSAEGSNKAVAPAKANAGKGKTGKEADASSESEEESGVIVVKRKATMKSKAVITKDQDSDVNKGSEGAEGAEDDEDDYEDENEGEGEEVVELNANGTKKKVRYASRMRDDDGDMAPLKRARLRRESKPPGKKATRRAKSYNTVAGIPCRGCVANGEICMVFKNGGACERCSLRKTKCNVDATGGPARTFDLDTAARRAEMQCINSILELVAGFKPRPPLPEQIEDAELDVREGYEEERVPGASEVPTEITMTD